MSRLLRFMADMTDTCGGPSLHYTKTRYLTNPDEVMNAYELSEDQQKAVKSGRADAIAEAIAKELQQGTFPPNW